MITYKIITPDALDWEEFSDELGNDGWRLTSLTRLEEGFHLVFERRADNEVRYRYFAVRAPLAPKEEWLNRGHLILDGFFCGFYQEGDEFRIVFYREEDNV